MAKKYEIKSSGITDKAGELRRRGETLDASEIADVKRLLELDAIVESEEKPKATEPVKPSAGDGKAVDPVK